MDLHTIIITHQGGLYILAAVIHSLSKNWGRFTLVSSVSYRQTKSKKYLDWRYGAMTISIMDFEKLCKDKHLSQFIFNTSDQPDERIGMGNCNCMMRFATAHVVLCPDSIYFVSKYKDNCISFSNIHRIEYIQGESGITNTIYIITKDDDKSEEVKYVVLANRS